MKLRYNESFVLRSEEQIVEKLVKHLLFFV